MDSFLGQRYGLPLADAVVSANPLKRRCLDIARYFLSTHVKPREDVQKRYNSALAWLKSIASGKQSLLGFNDSENGANRMDDFNTQVGNPELEKYWDYL